MGKGWRGVQGEEEKVRENTYVWPPRLMRPLKAPDSIVASVGLSEMTLLRVWGGRGGECAG